MTLPGGYCRVYSWFSHINVENNRGIHTELFYFYFFVSTCDLTNTRKIYLIFVLIATLLFPDKLSYSLKSHSCEERSSPVPFPHFTRHTISGMCCISSAHACIVQCFMCVTAPYYSHETLHFLLV